MKTQGNISELKFMSKAVEAGIAVSLPFGDNQKYDCITDRRGLNRVQIKSTSRLEQKNRLNTFNALVCHGGDSKKKYTKDDCDIIAVHVIPYDTWYLIPVEHVTGKCVKLYPHRTEERTYKYEEWRDKWDVL